MPVTPINATPLAPLNNARPASAATSQETPPTEHFSALPRDQQDDFQAKLQTLSQKGRLFRQTEPGGPLLKAEPMDVYNSLEHHAGLTWVVDKAGQQQEMTHTTRDTWGWQAYDTSSSSTRQYTSGNYSGSPILSWGDLSFVNTDAAGMPGVSKLPKPEGTALTGLYEHDASSYWQATGWIMDVPTSEVSITDWIRGSHESTKQWNQ